MKYGDDPTQFDNTTYENITVVNVLNTTGSEFAAKFSAGMLFRNPYNVTYETLWTTNVKSNLFRADLIVYLNIIGAIFVLIYSIFMRRTLVKMNADIDRSDVSPSDFALVVRNVPLNTTNESLKVQIEKQF